MNESMRVRGCLSLAVTLLMLAAYKLGIQQLRLKTAEILFGQEAGHRDESVAIELLA